MTELHGHTDTPRPVLLGTDIRTQEPVLLPYVDRSKGVALIGRAGTGKSTVLEHMILTDIENGTPGLVIDPHGSLVERVMQFAPRAYADRIILLEATQSAPFGLNLLDVRKPVDDEDDPVTWASDSVVATIKKLYGQVDDFLPRLERWLDVTARTLIPNGGTLADILKLFRSDDFRRQSLRNVDDPSIHDEWSEYESLRSTDQIAYIEAVVNRLGRMLRTPLLRSIIGSKKTTVPFDEVLYGDSMLLVSLPSEKLSQERCDFIGSLILHVFTDLAFTRKVSFEQPPRVHVYVDEYQRFASSTTSALSEQGRKYGVGLTMAHQTLQQIRDPYIRSASKQAGTLIVLGVTHDDAQELAGEFPITPTPEWIEEVETVDGEEPILVPVATPIDHLLTTPHADALTDKAARLLFAEGRTREYQLPPYTWRDPKTGKEHPGSSVSRLGIDFTRPMRRLPGDGKLSYPLSPYLHSRLNPFFVRAMNHAFDDPDRFADALVANELCFLGPSESLLDKEGYGNKLLEPFLEERALLLEEGFRPWIRAHLGHREKLKRDGVFLQVIGVDLELAYLARSRGWKSVTRWTGTPPEEVQRASILIGDPEHLMLTNLRERLRWLVVLCDGLAENPTLVPSGQMRPRKTVRLVHHAKQAEQDALNEFAAKLVNPKRKHVAHIKMLSGYYETRLRPPPDKEGGDVARTPDPYQPDDIRGRSRALYDASAHQVDVYAPVQPQQPPYITRRPRRRDTEEG